MISWLRQLGGWTPRGRFRLKLNFTTAIVAGLVLRLLVAAYNGFIGPSFGANSDALAFHFMAEDYARNLGAIEFQVGWIYSCFLAFVYALTFDSLFIGCVIPYALAPVAGYYKNQQFGTLDNKNPRAQTAALEGAGARAAAAQSNAWEALLIFAAAVFVNHATGGAPGTSATLALVWVAARILHGIFYITDIDKARSGVFLVGFVSAVALFFV